MYTADELEIRCALAGSPRAEQLIACLEGEIAKRDARIVELESAAESLRLSRDYHHEQENEYRRRWACLYAAPVSEAKAQGVVMPEGWIPLTIEHEPGYPEDVAFGPKRMMDRLKKWLDRYFEMRLNAAPVQQVSVPTWMASSRAFADRLYMAGWRDHADAQHSGAAGMYDELLAAAPAAPAADAGIVDMYRHLQKVTPYRFKKIQDASITDGGDVMYFHKDRFDAALLADMAAHCAAKGVV